MNTESKKTRNTDDRYTLLYIGIALLIIPLLYAPVVDAGVFERVHRYMIAITALGGGLVGGYLTGKIIARTPVVRATGGIAFALILLAFDPASKLNLDVQEARIETTLEASPQAPTVAAAECKRVESIAVLGWNEGHKNNFCRDRGWQGVTNFPGGVYRSNGGGFCFEGDEAACLSLALARIKGT